MHLPSLLNILIRVNASPKIVFSSIVPVALAGKAVRTGAMEELRKFYC